MQTIAAYWLFALRPLLIVDQNYSALGIRTLFWDYILVSTYWCGRAAGWSYERQRGKGYHWIRFGWARPRVHSWWACSVMLCLTPARLHPSHHGMLCHWQHTWPHRLWHRWTRRVRRSWLWVQVRTVHVAFHGYCCDTGPYTWTHSFRWVLPWVYIHQGQDPPTWRDIAWPGLAAWRATTYEALDNVSDGGTSYEVIKRRDLEHNQARRCDGCGAGNAPYSMTDNRGGNVFVEPITYHFCQTCYQYERAYDTGAW
jgi:hypothetical protein